MTPLDALVEECERLQFCASRDPIKMTKASYVFVNSLIGVFSKVQVTYVGVGLVVLFVILYMCWPAKYHEEKIHKFQ